MHRPLQEPHRGGQWRRRSHWYQIGIRFWDSVFTLPCTVTVGLRNQASMSVSADHTTGDRWHTCTKINKIRKILVQFDMCALVTRHTHTSNCLEESQHWQMTLSHGTETVIIIKATSTGAVAARAQSTFTNEAWDMAGLFSRRLGACSSTQSQN